MSPSCLWQPGLSLLSQSSAGLSLPGCKFFFAWRIYVLGQWRLVSGFIIALAVAQGGCALAAGFRYIPVKTLAELNLVYPMVSVWLGGSAACDIFIAASMLFFLLRAKTATMHKQTEKMLTRLVRLTIETGVATAATATVDLTLFFVFKNNNLHVMPAIVLAKMYTNTLLASLNSRSPLFNGRMQLRADTTWQWTQPATGVASGNGNGSTVVRITQETTKNGDELGTYDDGSSDHYRMKHMPNQSHTQVGIV